MATFPSSSSSKLQSLTLNNINNTYSQHPMMFFFITGFIISLCLTISFILYKKTEPKRQQPDTIERSYPEIKFQSFVEKTHQNDKTETTHLAIDDEEGVDDEHQDSVVVGSDCCDDGKVIVKKMKKKKRKKKKKKMGKKNEEDEEEEGRELVCLYPFTSTGSATQRKIKQQYDHLVKCNSSKGLTLAQVGEFANCLIDARNELQHKSEVIQRKFTITKALLFKADRSSFDRLHQQIYKLELEQKRLEEDAFVYNWLQEQLKLSPAYKKMLEISESMELKAKSKELAESIDDEFCDISFEELLAQEKKDSFWQKNGMARQWSR